MRLNHDEIITVAEEVAKRLARTRDPAVFMVPTAGFDSYGVKGQGFHNSDADAAFVRTLKQRLPDNIEVVEQDTHIDDPEFATAAARRLIQLVEARQNNE